VGGRLDRTQPSGEPASSREALPLHGHSGGEGGSNYFKEDGEAVLPKAIEPYKVS